MANVRFLRGVFILALTAAPAVTWAVQSSYPPPALSWFYQAASRNNRLANEALDQIARVWKDGYAAMVVDLARLMPPAPRPGQDAVGVGFDSIELVEDDAKPPARDPFAGTPLPADPSALVRARLVRFLEKQTGKRCCRCP